MAVVRSILFNKSRGRFGDAVLQTYKGITTARTVGIYGKPTVSPDKELAARAKVNSAASLYWPLVSNMYQGTKSKAPFNDFANWCYDVLLRSEGVTLDKIIQWGKVGLLDNFPLYMSKIFSGTLVEGPLLVSKSVSFDYPMMGFGSEMYSNISNIEYNLETRLSIMFTSQIPLPQDVQVEWLIVDESIKTREYFREKYDVLSSMSNSMYVFTLDLSEKNITKENIYGKTVFVRLLVDSKPYLLMPLTIEYEDPSNAVKKQK